MIPELINDKTRRWMRFLIGGASNTAFTYLVYLGLSFVVHYQIAYLVAYCSGVIYAYWFNATFVFKVPLSWKGALSYPFVYIIQYCASALLLELLVKGGGAKVRYAPLLVTVCMLPLTYVMSKLVLETTNRLARAEKPGSQWLKTFKTRK